MITLMTGMIMKVVDDDYVIIIMFDVDCGHVDEDRTQCPCWEIIVLMETAQRAMCHRPRPSSRSQWPWTRTVDQAWACGQG